MFFVVIIENGNVFNELKSILKEKDIDMESIRDIEIHSYYKGEE